MLTVMILLAIGAFACVVASAARPAWVPLWVGCLLLCVIELIRTLPLGK
jgi:hypothetical protein